MFNNNLKRIKSHEENALTSPVSIHEVTVAAALAALGATNLLFWQYAPLSTIFMLLSAFPFTLIGMREHFRVALLCVLIAMSIGFIIGGRILLQECLAVGMLGICVGYTEKQKSKLLVQNLIALILGLTAAMIIIILLAIFVQFRELNFQTVLGISAGISEVLTSLHVPRIGAGIETTTIFLLHNWVITALISIPIFVWFAFAFIRLTFAIPLRVTNNFISHINYQETHENGDINPVPVEFEHVGYAYCATRSPTPADLNACIPQHGLIAITGKNGAGKSTTLKLISGLITPSSGVIHRTGAIGLGEPQGTAMIFQRPESQVLGMRIKDDLNFGNRQEISDFDSILHQVGLTGLEEKNTTDLSGGQLQRLAIAVALTRNPALILSDESTSMLDPHGRKQIMSIYQKLSLNHCIIHISHNQIETNYANHTIDLPAQQSGNSPALHALPQFLTQKHSHNSITLLNISKKYLEKTPWESFALKPLDLHIRSGEIVTLTGVNGSGKSTLARIMTGLEKPSTGHILIDHQPHSTREPGAILLAAQHSSTQLLADTVVQEIGAYTAKTRDECEAALALMGLGAELLDLHPQNLSGGQQKRVVLAALFSSNPRILILDEPLAGCDQESIKAINQATELLSKHGTTIIIITHDIAAHDGIFHRHISFDQGTVSSDSAPATITDTAPETKTWFWAKKSPIRLHNIYGRLLPWDNPARNLWIGTKLFVIIAITFAIFARTDWYMFITIGIILLLWSTLAKLPLSAIPRPSWRFMLFFLTGQIGVIFGTKKHMVKIGNWYISAHGINLACEFSFMAAIMIFSYIIFTFTTPISEIPPFLQRFINRFPYSHLIRSLCIGIAVSLRQLSLISNENKTMRELSVQRIHERKQQGFLRRTLRTELAISLQSCALTIRLAQEMSLAILARGGAKSIGGQDNSPRARDYLIIFGTSVILIIATIAPACF